MYVTLIRLDLLQTANQISCCKGNGMGEDLKYSYIGFTSIFFEG